MKQTIYPEHEKLQAIKEKSQAIGEFIEWLHNNKKVIFSKYFRFFKGTYNEVSEGEEVDEEDVFESLMPSPLRIEETLAEYFDIDLKKLEEEKRAMLETLRQANAKEEVKK